MRRTQVEHTPRSIGGNGAELPIAGWRAPDTPLVPGTVNQAFGRKGKSHVDITEAINPIHAFEGNKVVILGLARQGMALARFFSSAGAEVVVSDIAPVEKLHTEISMLNGLPVGLALGGHPLSILDGCDLLCLSGGVPPQSAIVSAAIERGIPLSNDSLLTLQVANILGLGPVVAVTGSNGKTTTTALVDKMLLASGYQSHVGGNIGTPLLDRIAAIEPCEPIVLELSSFQLELFDRAVAWGEFDRLGPSVAAVLNITPNHLDRHTDMAAYAAAKLNVLRHMKPGGKVILNLDDPVLALFASELVEGEVPTIPPNWQLGEVLARAQEDIRQLGLEIVPFSRNQRLADGAWLEDDTLMYKGESFCRQSDVLLPGAHNVSNLLAAAAISMEAGACIAGVNSVARTFRGVAHRLEIVTNAGDVAWINDSIATSPERAVAGLRCFEAGEQTLILLAGGKDKNLPWDTFANQVLGRVSFLIGFGQSGPRIVNQVQERARFEQLKAPNCAVVQRLDEAVKLAERVAGPNSVVLMSPGGTSFDSYKNFEERGEHFRQLVFENTKNAAMTKVPVAG